MIHKCLLMMKAWRIFSAQKTHLSYYKSQVHFPLTIKKKKKREEKKEKKTW